MNSSELVQHLSKCLVSAKSEEATKLSMILPVITFLGYNINNPDEVEPEYRCSLTNNNDRVDFAIKHDNIPFIIIECKQAGTKLSSHTCQLSKYFVACKARYAILTNGTEYWLFTDLNKLNLMDEKPFFKIDLLNADSGDILFFSKLSKQNYDEKSMRTSASVRCLSSMIRDQFTKEMTCPSGEFLSMITKRCYSGIITKQVLEEVNDILTSGTNSDNSTDFAADDLQDDDVARAFDIICSIIKSKYEDAIICNFIRKSYVAITYYNRFHTICRLNFSKRKTISFPTDGYKAYNKIEIDSVEDIKNLTTEVLDAFLVAYNNRQRFL